MRAVSAGSWKQGSAIVRQQPAVGGRQLRPRRSRPLNPIRPMAIFTRYDPFGPWPPYRAAGGGGSSGANGGWAAGSSGSNNRQSGEQRLAAANPAQRQAMLSNAISGMMQWQQLYSLVERYGQYMTANNVAHALTKLEQLGRDEQYLPAEAAQVEDLLDWLLQRASELNVLQLGPQALGATAGAVSRLQQAQRQQQQQQLLRQQQLEAQRQQQEAEAAAAAEAAARKLRQQQAAAAERDQLMREVVDAAVSQKHRLSPQALNNLLTALAEIEESDMSAEDIRQLLHLPSKPQPAARPAATAPVPDQQLLRQQQQQQQLGRQQQQQQQQQAMSARSSSSSSGGRPLSPDSLQAAARQLGQLSPELAQEWYDRALQQGLQQGYIPRGIDQSYIPGFLAREIERAAANAGSSGSSSGGRGALLLSKVVAKYGALMGVDHLALVLHRLAQMTQHGTAGSDEEVNALAGTLFQQLQPLVGQADGATLASLIDSCKELQLYSKTLSQACLLRAKGVLEQQLQGFVDTQAGFSGRRLGVLLHGLAVLGLRPTDGWLRLAVTAAGALMPSCSITDLERLASALLIMRVNPGHQWTSAAEDRLEQLAAALGSGDSRRLRGAAEAEASSDEDEEATGNARRAMVACVKALALLGGRRAHSWYQNILAAEQEEQQLLEQQQQQQAEEEELLRRQQAAALQPQQQERQFEEEEQVRQRRLQEFAKQRAALAAQQQQQQQQQQPRASSPNEQPVERQLKKAVQKQQHKGLKMHSHQHTQHRNAAPGQQQQQAGRDQDLAALSSLDDYMSQELLAQQQQQQQGSRQPQELSSNLPQSRTPVSVPDADDEQQAAAAAAPTAAAAAEAKHGAGAAAAAVEAAAPVAWAAEQASRWAQTSGEAAHPSPAAELQQRLDDSSRMFGSSAGKRSSGGSGAAGQRKQQAAAAAAAGQQGGSKQQRGLKPLQGPDAAGKQAGKLQPKGSSTGPAQPQDIPVSFVDADSPHPGSSSRGSGGGGGSSKGSSKGSNKAGQATPSAEAQRSAAEAADALAALMAEIEGESVAESEQEEVLRELGLTGEDATLAEAQAQTAELQEAAELVKQATKQLDDLQKQQQQPQGSTAAGAAEATPAGAGAAGDGSAEGQSKAAGSHSRQHKHSKHDKKQHKQGPDAAAPTAAGSTSSSSKKSASSSSSSRAKPERQLGSSGDAAFVAAAKALEGNKPSRTLLLGCLEAIQQQQEQLRLKLAEQQVQSAVAGAAARQQASKDPAARKLQQLKADFDRARERAAQEKSSIRASAAADVVEKLLPLLDSFEAAEAALDQQQQQLGGAGEEREYEEARRVYSGLHAQLLSILKSQGARVLGENGRLVGKPFDPQDMEAVMRQPATAGFSDGDVLRVLRKGYAVGDKLVRPALVMVAYED